MSEVGLGRVKTQRCCDDIEWVFRQATFLIVQASWACSVAIDFGKLFSSSFNFSSFYTARVNRYQNGPSARRPLSPRKRPNCEHCERSVSCHVWTAPSWQELFSRLQHW